MITLSDKLLEAQKQMSIDALWRVVLTKGAVTHTFERDRILSIDHEEQLYNHKATIILDNSDGPLTDLDLKGYQAVIGYGAVTVGKEYCDRAPQKVIGHRLDSSEGRLLCTFELIGMPNLVAEDRASASYIPDDEDIKTVKTIISDMFDGTMACYSHCPHYTIDWDSEDDLIDSYAPKSSFRIYINGSRLAALRRLLDYTKCLPVWGADGHIHIVNPTTTGTTYNYEHSLEEGHTFFAKTYRKRLVIPNQIIVQSQPDDDPQIDEGSAADAASYAALGYYVTQFEQTLLEDHAQADAIALAILSKYQMQAEAGAADLPINCGAEILDYVKVTDSRENDYRTGNIGALHFRVNPNSKNHWTMTFSFGGWASVRGLMSNLELYPSGFGSAGQYFSRLSVKDLYAENITADNILLYTMDEISDGDTYKRVLATQISAGKILISDECEFVTGYDPTGKEIAVHRGTTAPTDTTKLWLDTTATPYIWKRWSGSAWVQCSVTDLDNLADGTTYKRLLATDISAGHIQLTNAAVIVGEWYNKSGVEIDADNGINIYGTDSAFTTRATKTGTIQCKVDSSGKIVAGAGKVTLSAAGINIWGKANALTTRATEAGTIQCYVGADGKLYAGAGAVILDQYGLECVGDSVLRFSYPTVGLNKGYIFAVSDGFKVNSVGLDLVLVAGGAGDYIILEPHGGSVIPYTDNSIKLGEGSYRFSDVYCVTLHQGDSIFSNDWKLTESEDGKGIRLLRPDGSVAEEWR